MNWFFVFFLVSGFCGLVYEVVWLRLAMAQFGVTTALTSIVLSVFMGGLALGSWLAGRLARRLDGRGGVLALRAYGLAELALAVSGVVVPRELAWGGGFVGALGGFASGSSGHYVASTIWLVVTILPFCTAMGATFPLAMTAMRARFGAGAERSFSFLYLANVLGGLGGTVTSAFVLIEMLGFRGTSLAAAALNATLAAAAFTLSRAQGRREPAAGVARRSAEIPESVFPPAFADPSLTSGPARADVGGLLGRSAPWLLCLTGLISLAMEVVWIRQFTPYLGTVVYAFAAVLAVYLAGTFIGSRAYRWWAARRAAGKTGEMVLFAYAAVGFFGLLPILVTDPRLPGGMNQFGPGVIRVVLGITPFCTVVGFLTPLLVDSWSGGDPDRAGSAYAMNVVGSIAGPLVAGFLILPWIGESWALLALAGVVIVAGLIVALGPRAAAHIAPRRLRAARILLAGVAVASLPIVTLTRSYESVYSKRVVKRDYTATVAAVGEGSQRNLLVNGVGMAALTPLCKVMAHLPMAFLSAPPKRGLVICFGMGTTFRSMMSWQIPTTVVELVPSVPSLFWYFHEDAAKVLGSPLAHVVIDDGRRFMEWSRDEYDVITLDPPPPVEAAGSSLLYSHEFYTTAKKRLRPGGILQQWFPSGDQVTVAAVVRAIRNSFPYVRAFQWREGFGLHLIASMSPIPMVSDSVLAARLPESARADLVEWFVNAAPKQVFQTILSLEVSPDSLIAREPGIPELSDDRAVNEYYLLRRWFSRRRGARSGGA